MTHEAWVGLRGVVTLGVIERYPTPRESKSEVSTPGRYPHNHSGTDTELLLLGIWI